MNGAVEWVGGVAKSPSYVVGEGEPYRPDVVLWLIPGGPILAMDVLAPGVSPGQVALHLLSTINDASSPPTPQRVRVDSPELAKAIRSAVGETTEVICAPTPEIDEVIRAFRQHRKEDPADAEASYLTPGVDADRLATFFGVAARLYRAAPWRVVPGDGCLLSATIEALGVHETVVSVIGQMGESHGVVLFASQDDYEAYLDVATALDREELPTKLPRHMGLTYDRGRDVSAPLRKEISAHRWEVAGKDAYPSVLVVDEDLVGRLPTAAELTRVEAIAAALADLLERVPTLTSAWEGGPSVSHTVTVSSAEGPVQVTLRAPFGEDHLTVDYDDDEEAAEQERADLLGAFEESQEGRAFPGGADWSELLLAYAYSYLGKTPMDLEAADVREIVFEIFPRKVTCDFDVAPAIVEELRALFSFMKRELGFKRADACLRVLGKDAAKLLARALSDPGNFGMAKTMMMAGAELGYDISSQEGVEAWMRKLRTDGIPPSVRLPEPHEPRPPVPARADDRARKKAKRKSQRKARKKGR